MTAQPLISIITPSYNQGGFIQRTIDSVLSQNIPDMEYVIVDGGSTDETLSILSAYDGRVSWRSEPDGGHSDAINKGIFQSSGAIIGWLNSDDIYYPDALHQVLAFFEDNPGVDVVYGDANHIDSNDKIIERYPSEPWSFERLKEICFLPQPATFLRRPTIEHFGPLDTRLRYSMDYEYWLRLALGGARFGYLPRLLAATRLHPEAATLAQRVACHAFTNDVTRRHLGRTPDRWLFNYAHAVVDSHPRLERGRPFTTLVLAGVSVYAAVRWNHTVSRSMLVTLSRWLLADTLRPLRRRPAGQ